jgi:hypothetical protein
MFGQSDPAAPLFQSTTMTIPAVSDYRDRRTGLVVFGVLEVAIGALCTLMIPLMLIGRVVASRSPNAPPAPITIVPAIAVYGLLAAAFIWLGIGSILARRWARALLLCFSAVALCGGLISCAWMALMLPRLFEGMAQQSQGALQPGALLMVKVITAVVMAVIYVLIPLALFLFYRSPHVRRTCEVRDPVERWTDRCPLPVLALSLLMGIGGVLLLGISVKLHALPLFGVIASGAAGWFAVLFVAGLLLYVARGLYLLQKRACWIALAMQLIGAASSIVTFWATDLTDLYLKMGMDPQAAAATAHLLALPSFRWLFPLSIVPWLAWLLWIRRYFKNPTAPALPSESESTAEA